MRMKKLIHLSLVAICCLGLFGCPYESQVPISTPNIAVDNRLLGVWSSKDEVYNTYIVSKGSDKEYRIVQKNISNTSKFTGFLSEVKGTLFMNLRCDSTGTYYLYKFRLDAAGNKFSLLPLSDNLPDHFGSMDGLKNYMEKNMNFQSFYNETDKSDFEKINTDESTVFRN